MRRQLTKVLLAAKAWRDLILLNQSSSNPSQITNRMLNMLPYAFQDRDRLIEALGQYGYLPGKPGTTLIPEDHGIADEALMALWRFCGLDPESGGGQDLHPWLPKPPVQELPPLEELIWGIKAIELWLSRTDHDIAGGPCSNGFNWEGNFHSLTPQQKRLFDLMWDKTEQTLSSVIYEVWDRNKEPSNNAVSQALKKLNQILANAGVPWSLSIKYGNIIRN